MCRVDCTDTSKIGFNLLSNLKVVLNNRGKHDNGLLPMVLYNTWGSWSDQDPCWAMGSLFLGQVMLFFGR